MKKILALALALLMVATTVSLAACSKDDEDPDADEDEGYEYNNDGGKQTEADTDSADTSSEEETETEEIVSGEWITMNDKVYVGMDNVALREGPGRTYEMVETLKAGVALTRTATNGSWHKVLYEGKECYVRSALTTTDGDDFSFVAYEADEQINLHVKGDFQINLRSTPFYHDDYSDENLAISGFTARETDGDDEALKLLAKSKSGDWYKVAFTGTWGSKSYTEQVFYIAASSAQYITGLAGVTTPDGNGGNVLG